MKSKTLVKNLHGRFSDVLQYFFKWFVCRRLGPNEVTVRLGMVDLKDPVFIERKVNKAEENSEVDLVLLRMEEQVYFHEAVSPICLPHDVDLNLSGKVEFKF